MQHIVRIADPDDLLALQDGERVDLLDDLGDSVLWAPGVEFGVLQRVRGVVHLVHRQQVGEDLRWVVEVREGVDDGDRGMLDEGLEMVTTLSVWIRTRKYARPLSPRPRHGRRLGP